MLYIFENDDFKKLVLIKTRLYDDSKAFSADDKRDIANLLDTLLSDKVIIINEDQIK